MNKFKSFEEISSAHPLDNESNYYYLIGVCSCYVTTEKDKRLAQAAHPFGWEDKQSHKWFFYDMVRRIWYDCYIYDGTKWTLGIESWDGIVEADEPEWGIKKSKLTRRDQAIFKTPEEAEEYRQKIWMKGWNFNV